MTHKRDNVHREESVVQKNYTSGISCADITRRNETPKHHSSKEKDGPKEKSSQEQQQE